MAIQDDGGTIRVVTGRRRTGITYIYTPKAPTPGAYSQGILVDTSRCNILFIAGQTGNDPNQNGEPVVLGGVGPQTRQILKNILAIVEAAGGDATSLVDMNVYIKHATIASCDLLEHTLRMSRECFNEAYRAFFAEHGMAAGEHGNLPVRCQVWVSEIPWESEDTVIEIKAYAAIPR